MFPYSFNPTQLKHVQHICVYRAVDFLARKCCHADCACTHTKHTHTHTHTHTQYSKEQQKGLISGRMCPINTLIVLCWMDWWVDGFTICSIHIHCLFSNVLNAILLWGCQNQLPLSLRTPSLLTVRRISELLRNIWQELPHSARERKRRDCKIRSKVARAASFWKTFYPTAASHMKALTAMIASINHHIASCGSLK